MTRLCFGTFAQILRLCKLGNVTDPQLVGTMTQTVDPKCGYIKPENATQVSRLLSCTGNLSTGRMRSRCSGAMKEPGISISNVIEMAQKADKADVVRKFDENVLRLLDEDKKEKTVLALLDLIAGDTVLDGDKKLNFEKYVGTTKNALLSQDEFVLADFLAGIFLYTTAAGVVNTAGRSTVVRLTEEYIGGLSNTRKIKIVNRILFETVNLPTDYSFTVEPCQVATASCNTFDQQVDEDVLNESAKPQSAKAKPDFASYLQKAKEKYNTIKTLLYSNQPKPFYDFYVCNNIERRIPAPSKFGTSYRTATIGNVTVKSLMECSRFVILAGAGGLGKSMMMRHLLLNSIENYTEMLTIPVFIPLKDFDETVESLFDYIYLKVTGLCVDIGEEQFEEALDKGKCLLLFDGLDEIGSAHAKRFERELETFTDKYPDNCYVISSRPYQSFISYSRFTVLQLKPFSKKQALMLIDNLEFRPDEPIIKEKFRAALDENLYRTHNTFIENPLLLTIMLLTFEQYAEVPSKMHLFYREAFAVLSVKHDASKGAYKRTLKTGLTVDKFADYFAELCSRSYYDEKFEMTEEEFAKYYNVLKEREKSGDKTSTASDYLYDLCSNMCLMYFESGKYHFTHRSFQEYFCALYFSKQKDKNLQSIGDFFENRHSRMFGDKTFNMLYDMIPDKVEEYIFLPFLTRLYERCDSGDGYWTFLEEMYPHISYENGETNEFSLNLPNSYLLEFIEQLNHDFVVECDDFPHYDSLVTSEYVYAIDEDENQTLINTDDIGLDYKAEYGTPDTVGWGYEFDVEEVRQEPTKYKDLMACLEDDGFALKEEYEDMREYLSELKEKQRSIGDSLFDLFT